MSISSIPSSSNTGLPSQSLATPVPLSVGTGKTSADTSTSSMPSASSQLHLSSAALEIQSAMQNSGSDINVEKVSALRAAIQSGSYRVNSQAVADGLIASTRELIKARERSRGK